MIKFFRHIRQRLLSESRFSKYLLYAIGEIFLVVVGILIALQINNWNERRKQRAKEITYLKNLKVDLRNEIENSEQFAAYHFQKAKTSARLLDADVPRTIQDVQLYTDRYERVFMWSSFVPNNNTFKELLSSGNLSLIENDRIKNGLLELDKAHADITAGEYHVRREYEEYLYDPHFRNATTLAFYNISEPRFGIPDKLDIEQIPTQIQDSLIKEAQWQHDDRVFQNGLRLAVVNNSLLAKMHKELVEDIRDLMGLIDDEIGSNSFNQ